MVKKKTKKQENAIPAAEEKLKEPSGFQEHLQEPLFLTALAGFVFSILMFYSGSGFLVENGWILLLVLLGLSLYFLNMHLKAKTKNKMLYGIPVLLFVAMWFSYMMTQYPNSSIARDYLIFTVIAGLFLLFYALASHKIINLSVALMLALFFSTLLTHFIPATDIYLAEIDPHWHYKWAQGIANDGHIPDYDYLTYPMKGGMAYYGKEVPNGQDFGLSQFYNETAKAYPAGLDMSNQRFYAALFMGSMYTALKPLGFSLEDAAMLYPLVIGAFAIIAFYLLLRYMFEDMKPYNEAVGILGAFMLFMSPVFATKAAAGNCEDDILGMFLVISSFMFFVLSFRRKSLVYTIAGSVTLLMLSIAWGGYDYVILVLGGAMALHAITSYVKNEYCINLPPYAIIMYAVSKMDVLFLHRHGLEYVSMPSIGTNFTTLAFLGSMALSVILEYFRVEKNGQILADGNGIFDRLQNIIEKNIKTIGMAVIALSLIALVIMGPMKVVDKFFESIAGAKVQDVVGKTIAEQNPMAGDIWSFLKEGYLRYGLALVYGICMIPILLYLAFDKNSFGAALTLSWSLPMIWGVYNKSQLLFNSSAPIAALGATIGIYAVLNEEELNGMRIVSAIMILMIPLLYMPFMAGDMYAKFVGVRTLYTTMTQEMYLWRPSLDWLSEKTQPNEAVITWWDYGHWITAISHRPVTIDNLQADAYEIQDVARFFMLKRDQEDAMNTLRAYNKRYSEIGENLTHVMIDWTMIGKGSALHFIATGVIENKTEGSGMNYAQCRFLESPSSQQSIATDKEGNPVMARKMIFGCSWPISGLMFEIIGDEITSIKVIVVDESGSQYFIPWETWVKDRPASILGVQPLSDILVLGSQRPDVLGNLDMTWKDQVGMMHSAETYQLIYVPGEFNDYMMTRLYLGEYVDYVPGQECLKEENKNKVYCANYLNQGLFTGNLTSFKPKYFSLQEEFSGGYVRVYDINYTKT